MQIAGGRLLVAGCRLFVVLRVAETNKYTKIAPDFGSSSRRAKESILSICDFWRNAEDGPKDKSAVADCFIYFRGPTSRLNVAG